MLALNSFGFDEVKHGISITFDGDFQKTYDAMCVLSKEGSIWHYFVFERGSTSHDASFNSTDDGLNFLFWDFVRPNPNYSVIYRDLGQSPSEIKFNHYIAFGALIEWRRV